MISHFRISRTRNIQMSFQNSQYLAGLENPGGAKKTSGGDVCRKSLAGGGLNNGIQYYYDYSNRRRGK